MSRPARVVLGQGVRRSGLQVFDLALRARLRGGVEWLAAEQAVGGGETREGFSPFRERH